MSRCSVILGTLTLIVLVATPAGAAAQGGQKYDTPQAVFDAFIKAVKNDDWKTAYGCLTEDSRNMMVGGLAAGSLFLKGFMEAFADKDQTGKVREILKTLDNVLTKHKVTKDTLEGVDFKALMAKAGKEPPPEVKMALKKAAAKIKNPAAFLGDMMKAMKQLGKMGGKDVGFDANAQLKDLKVDGDKAFGTIVSMKDGAEKRQPITFERVGGSWRMEMPMGGPGGPGGARLDDRPLLNARRTLVALRSQ